MTAGHVKRKLVAILSADVEGYSRLMGDDEVLTVRTIEDFRQSITALTQQYRGRIVDSPGDNVLAEFVSVVDAVQCAVEIQEVLRGKNAELPDDRRMKFRIGINLGDVIEEGDRIYGDGVNIAARIEGLAEAGGICISGSAYEQIENKLALGYEYIGEHNVKNIRKPIRVYRIPMESEPGTSPEGTQKRTRSKGLLWAALGAVFVLAVAGATWNYILRPASIQPDETLDELKKKTQAEKSLKAQLIFWESIKDSKDRQMYEEYLVRFPDGIFAGLAKLNIEKYSKSKATVIMQSSGAIGKGHAERSPGTPKMHPKMPKQKSAAAKSSQEDYEIIFWKSIENSTNIAVFQEYLNRFPNGTFAGLAKIKIKTLTDDKSKKITALAKSQAEEKKKILTDAKESSNLNTQSAQESKKNIEDIKEEKKIASHLSKEKEAQKLIASPQPPEEFKAESTIELAIFPWHFDIKTTASYASTQAALSKSVDGLSQVLDEYPLAVPKFSYYDIGSKHNIKSIKGNPLSETMVNDIWIKKSYFSKKKVNTDLICKLGRQLQVDAVLMYSIFIETIKQTADIILIEVETQKVYFRTETIYVRALNSDIKKLTENLLVEYVNEKYQSSSNYEMIFWEFIKDSQNEQAFRKYLTRFPNGTFAGLAKLKLAKR